MTENPKNSRPPAGLPECCVFVGVSLDGFLAKPDGDLNWMDEASGDAGDHGYETFIADIDTLVWGRKTFEKVMAFDKWYHGKRRVVVLSHKPLDLGPARAKGAVVEQMSGTPVEVAARLGESGARHLYIDGGQTIQGFLRAGLIRRLIVSQLPILLGQGVPLFGALPNDVKLRHIATRTFPGGMVQSEYRIP